MIDYDVHFGRVRMIPVKMSPEIDPDDEELEQTPEDVIQILGFDPKEIDED